MGISDWSSDVCSSDLVEMATVGEADLPDALRAFQRRGADYLLHDADLVRLGEPVGEPAHQRIDARMRGECRLVDPPQPAEALVPQVEPAVGREARARPEQIVEGRGAHADRKSVVEGKRGSDR